MTDSEQSEELAKLRELIEKARYRGETYESLGTKAGVSSTTVYRVDKGEGEPRRKTINKLTGALEYLLSRGEKEQGVLEGYSSPFSLSESPLEDEYREVVEQIRKIIKDESIPLAYKRELLEDISTVSSSIRRLAEE